MILTVGRTFKLLIKISTHTTQHLLTYLLIIVSLNCSKLLMTSLSTQEKSNILLLQRQRNNKKFSHLLQDSNFLFEHMQPAVKLVDREAARKQFTAVSKLNKRSQVLEILSINNQLVICLLENGRCSIHNLCK
jgi:hypothetical protein